MELLPRLPLLLRRLYLPHQRSRRRRSLLHQRPNRGHQRRRRLARLPHRGLQLQHARRQFLHPLSRPLPPPQLCQKSTLKRKPSKRARPPCARLARSAWRGCVVWRRKRQRQIGVSRRKRGQGGNASPHLCLPRLHQWSLLRRLRPRSRFLHLRRQCYPVRPCQRRPQPTRLRRTPSAAC